MTDNPKGVPMPADPATPTIEDMQTREQIIRAVCPILLACDECDMPQILNGPRPECRHCPETEPRGGKAGCRLVAELVADAALSTLSPLIEAARDEGWKHGIEHCARRHDAWAAKAAVRANDAHRRGNNLQQGYELTEVRVHEASASDLRADARALSTFPAPASPAAMPDEIYALQQIALLPAEDAAHMRDIAMRALKWSDIPAPPAASDGGEGNG